MTSATPATATRQPVLAAVVFYGGLTLLLLLVVTGALHALLPGGLARQVGHNSEAFCFAILVAGLVQVARPRARASTSPAVWTAVGATGLLLLAVLLAVGPWPTSVVTLNEAFAGAAMVWVYMMLPRPFRRPAVTAAAVSLGVLVAVVVFFRTALVLDQAESLVPMILAPLALDLADRTVLEPEQPDRRVRRAVWVVVLLALAGGFLLAAPGAREDLDGAVPLLVDYGQRAAEAYYGWILVHLYFGVLLPPRLRRAPAGAPTRGAA